MTQGHRGQCRACAAERGAVDGNALERRRKAGTNLRLCCSVRSRLWVVALAVAQVRGIVQQRQEFAGGQRQDAEVLGLDVPVGTPRAVKQNRALEIQGYNVGCGDCAVLYGCWRLVVPQRLDTARRRGPRCPSIWRHLRLRTLLCAHHAPAQSQTFMDRLVLNPPPSAKDLSRCFCTCLTMPRFVLSLHLCIANQAYTIRTLT